MILAALFLVAGFVLGALGLFSYMVWRVMGNKDWDDSNMTNAFRLLSHVVMHPKDFGKMYYLTDEQRQRLETTSTYGDKPLKRPFWYVSEDEFSEVVKTRP